MKDGAEDSFAELSDERIATDIRRRQFRAYLIHLPVTVPAVVSLAALSAWGLGHTQHAALVWACAICVFAIELATLTHAYVNRFPLAQISRADLLAVKLLSTALAISLTLPIAFVYPELTDAHHVVVVAIVAALIGTGGFVLAPIAGAGYGWTICTSVIALIALQRSGRYTADVLSALLAAYCVIVLIVIQLSSKNYLNRIRAESRAEKQKEWVDLLLKDFEGSARDWLWESDASGKLQHVSVKLVEAFAMTRAALEDASMIDLLRSSMSRFDLAAAEEHDFLQLRLAARRAFRDQIVPVGIHGETRWWSLSAKPLFNTQGQHSGWRGVGSDVTEAKRREQEMTQLANFDALTGLANRRQFHACLDAALRELDRERKLDLFMIDLDNFKSVNDKLGHAVGDEILRSVASRLDRVRSEGEILCRLGGDEYALISDIARSDDDRRARGLQLLAALTQPIAAGENRIEIHASIGVATAPEHGATTEALMKAADAALYAAKDEGRSRVNVYDRELDARSQKRAELQSELARAIELGAFEMKYQPQIDTRTMEVVGFEALIRWPLNDRQYLAPSDFIPIAEETGMIVPLGQWVLRRACMDCRSWPQQLFVAVNCSAVQFASRTLLETIEQAVTAAGIATSRVEIEITESSLVADSAHARETLKELRARGHRIALDDFGTGYSSLAYLRSFPIDRLKIDGAFTAGLLDDGNGEASAIVRAIVQLAAALKLRTTAEGVETAAQLDALRARGCFESQGFYFAHPMAGVDVPAFLEAWETERLGLLTKSAAVA